MVFTPQVIKEAVRELREALPGRSEMKYQALTIQVPPKQDVRYGLEREFFAVYQKGCEFAHFEQDYIAGESSGVIRLWVQNRSTRVSIDVSDEIGLDKVFGVFDSSV